MAANQPRTFALFCPENFESSSSLINHLEAIHSCITPAVPAVPTLMEAVPAVPALMEDEFLCGRCNKVLLKKNRNGHMRRNHQVKVNNVRVRDGILVAVKRITIGEHEGKIECPGCHNFWTAWPDYFKTHAKGCNQPAAVADGDGHAAPNRAENDVLNADEEQESVEVGDRFHESPLLRVFNLGLHLDYGYLCCLRKKCCFALFGDFWSHLSGHLRDDRKPPLTAD